jgi:hypothetical protein
LAAALGVLSADGPSLGRPSADTIHGARHADLKELRPGSSGRSGIRVPCAFGPDRQAILLADEPLDEHNANLGRGS